MKTQIKIDLDIYPAECVNAAVRTSAEAGVVKLKTEGKKNISAGLEVKSGRFPDEEALAGGFYNEILHHVCRMQLASLSQVLRERIVAQALISAQLRPAAPASAPVLDAELEKDIEKLLKEAESADHKKDPLGIAVPRGNAKKAGKNKANKKDKA